MSEKIPTAGKIWLWILLAIQAIGAISGLLVLTEGPIYIAATVVAAVEAVILFLLLKGKGLPMYIAYVVWHLVNVVLGLYMQYDPEKIQLVPYLTGAIIGLTIVYVTVYYSVRNTFEKKAQ